VNMATPANVLVVITSSPSLEGQVIDWLLSQDRGTGFSSVPVNGHSTRHDHLSVAEQVIGRQRRLQFQVQIEGERCDAFLESLKGEFAGADIHYWVVPVFAAGQLD
jgi:hypothetical protein